MRLRHRPPSASACGWVQEHIEETLTFYRPPRQHHKHLKSTNLIERLNEEIKRRTHVRLEPVLMHPDRKRPDQP